MKLAVLGAGRMGRAVAAEIAAADDLESVGMWSRSGGSGGAGKPGQDPHADLDGLLHAADVAIDFTLPEATTRILEAAKRHKRPLVCGVTGLSTEQRRALESAARAIPLLYDRNMSLGIAVLTELVERAAAGLGTAFTAAVHEIHHVHKKDAPSGTALQLGEALARGRGQDFRTVYRFAASEPVTHGSRDEIVLTAERRGEIAGEHRVSLVSDNESLSLSHAVTDRRVFAAGALLAARWLSRQPPGMYAMRDVVRTVREAPRQTPGGGGGGAHPVT